MKVFKAGVAANGGRTQAGTAVIYIVLFGISMFMALPFIYSVMHSLKPLSELFAYPPRFFVSNPTVENFKQLFRVGADSTIPMGRFVVNSLFVSLFGTALYTLIASLAAYPLALGHFKGRDAINKTVVNALLFTSPVLGTAQYFILAQTKLLNTYMAIMAPTLTAPLGLFLMRQFMTQMVPYEMIEAAKIDGASHPRTFFRVVMPIVRPAWLTLIILTFQSLWKGTGSQFVYDDVLKQLPTILGEIAAEGITRAGVGAASAVLLMIPPVTLFIFAQNKVVETMASAGIK